MKYEEFLASKAQRATAVGISVPPEPHEMLFPFQRDCVKWALRMGRAALFQGCGLGKSFQALEWARAVTAHTGRPVLILTPLAVAAQFVREADKLGLRAAYVREPGQLFGGHSIWITNYERLDKFRHALHSLGGVVLDESSILKAYDGKTRTALIEAFAHVPFRLCATATPAPNDHVELGNHAEFLGIMSRTEMLATWFCHDGGETQVWRLKGHARRDFWAWVASWAVCLGKPSDLGYSDDGYDLPPLRMVEHVVDVDAALSKQAGLLFGFEAATLGDQREVRRASLADRVAMAATLINASAEQWTVWCQLNDESKALAAAITGAVEVTGSDSADHKESATLHFVEGKHRVLVSKSDICGFGVNMQTCARTLFIGADHSWEKYYQTVRRHYRFGQRREVEVHLVTTSADGRVVANLERKDRAAESMQREMVAAMGDITRENLGLERKRTEQWTGSSEGAGWKLLGGDCVESLRTLEADSVDFSVYSPPFASLYVYSDSDRDLGNCRTHEEFFEHYTYALAEIYRVTKPGRLSSVHCMTLPTSKARDGVIGLTDFPGEIVRAHESVGWIYHSKVTIWKDPVSAMQRTKALGLLHKQLIKDSAMSRQGIPDEVLTFRKPGANAAPVSHERPGSGGDDVEHGGRVFPVDIWQQWASPVWMDIDPSDTLQHRSAREDADERHICPLQLGVIRRCVLLWTNPGDLVLSPFAGIGSEGHVALHEGRRFLGCELKPSYYAQAEANLRAAESRNLTLFGAAQ